MAGMIGDFSVTGSLSRQWTRNDIADVFVSPLRPKKRQDTRTVKFRYPRGSSLGNLYFILICGCHPQARSRTSRITVARARKRRSVWKRCSSMARRGRHDPSLGAACCHHADHPGRSDITGHGRRRGTGRYPVFWRRQTVLSAPAPWAPPTARCAHRPSATRSTRTRLSPVKACGRRSFFAMEQPPDRRRRAPRPRRIRLRSAQQCWRCRGGDQEGSLPLRLGQDRQGQPAQYACACRKTPPSRCAARK